MIKIGEINDLEIIKKKDFGVYLTDGTTEVLLPIKKVPSGASLGDVVPVFVYRDSDDRIIATTDTPLVQMGELAVLECKSVTSIGAFLYWGLEKDILLPFKEQTCKVKVGGKYLVRIYLDRSERICASMKVYNDLVTDSPFKVGDEVAGTVIQFNPEMGAFVAVENKYFGLVPLKEIHSRINVGDQVNARVAVVRPDGKLNLTLQKAIRAQMDEDAQMVYKIIQSYGGEIPFTDKADKAIVEREFGLSKNAFKRAVGRLLKEGKIEIKEKSIALK